MNPTNNEKTPNIINKIMSKKKTTVDPNKAYFDFFDFYMVSPHLAIDLADKWQKPRCTPELLNFIHRSQPDHIIKAACTLLRKVPVAGIDFRTVIEIFAGPENNQVIQSSLIPILKIIPERFKIPDTVSIGVLLNILHDISRHHRLADVRILTDIIIKLIGMIADTHLNYRDTLCFLTTKHSTTVRDQVININDRIPVDHLNLDLLLEDLIKYPPGTLVSQELKRIVERIPSDKLDYDKVMKYYDHADAQESHKDHALQLLRKMDDSILVAKGNQILTELNSLP